MGGDVSDPDPKNVLRRLIDEGETVVGRFACSGTHVGTWLGHPASGRRFTDVVEGYFFRVVDGRTIRAWGLEVATALHHYRWLNCHATSTSWYSSLL
jgi:predicted ester cyclase